MSGRAAMNTLHAFYADHYQLGRGAMLAELDAALNEPFDAVERRESADTIARMRAIGIEVVDA